MQDSSEPLLPGWTFDVTDQNNVPAGTITTRPKGSPPVCLTLPAGTCTVTEQGQAGWVATTPTAQTVTVSPGQSVTVTFGNSRSRRRRAVGR